jgi:hypothetical protein
VAAGFCYKPVTEAAWSTFTQDVRKIFKEHEDIIAREFDLPDRAPVADDECFCGINIPIMVLTTLKKLILNISMFFSL